MRSSNESGSTLRLILLDSLSFKLFKKGCLKSMKMQLTLQHNVQQLLPSFQLVTQLRIYAGKSLKNIIGQYLQTYVVYIVQRLLCRSSCLVSIILYLVSSV